MLSASLIDALKLRFPDIPFVFDRSSQPFARLEPDCEEVGVLEIYDDGDEATVSIREISHTHFNPYQVMPNHDRNTWIADAVIDFLAALFTDRILLFRSPDRRQGGFHRHEHPIDRSSSVPGTEHYQCFVWSGPVAEVK